MISTLRILLVPVFTLLYVNGKITQAMAVLLLSAASDVIDGSIARRFNMVTRLGKILDPVADKLIQAAMMLCALKTVPEVWALLGLHVLRELMLAAMGLYVMRVTGEVHSSKWYGKLCTAIIYAVMIAALAFPQMPRQLISLGVLLCSALIAMCLCLYMLNYLRILKKFRSA